MKNIAYLKSIGKLLFFCWLCTLCRSAAAQTSKRPNIVIILADDLGWGDVGYHGSDIMTPHIDGLAKQGVILNRYYSAPICSPARAGLLTGRYPNRFGIRQTTIPPWSDFGLDTSEVLLPQMLASAGYKNRAILGKWHLGHAYQRYLPLSRGFTHFYGCYNGALDYFTHIRQGEVDWHRDRQPSKDTGYTTDLITEEAVRCIDAYAADKSPFLLYVAYNAPHGPFEAKDEDLKLYGFDPNKPRFGGASPTGEDSATGTFGHGNTLHQTYKAMVTCMDRGIGQILARLKEKHLENNTIVLFMSDNGAPKKGGSNGELKGVKFEEWEGGVRVPAVIRWPEGLSGHRVVKTVVGYVDVMPTLLAAAGVQQTPKKPFDGINVLSALQGAPTAQVMDRKFYLGHGAMIGNHWKLIKANSGNPRMKITKDMLFAIPPNFREDKEQNQKNSHPEVYKTLKAAILPFDQIKAPREILTKGSPKGFITPKDWIITQP